MSETPDNLDELISQLDPPDAPAAAKALDEITEMKGRGATKALTDFLRIAPVGLLATRAAMALEKRKHRSCLPALYEIYDARPELAEDIIPIFSALEDPEGVVHIVPRLRDLMVSSARLSALAYLVKCADGEALAELLLPMLFLDPIPQAQDDLMWALEHVLDSAEDDAVKRIGATARAIGPEAFALVEPFMPPESELEKQAPLIARSLLDELEKRELIELVPGSDEALVEVLSGAILEARSEKGLIGDVERILLHSPSVEELYGDKSDIRAVFEALSNRS